MRFAVGVDLGQVRDFTAIAIAERLDAERVWAIRHLQRFELGTPYPEIVEEVRVLMNRSPLRGESVLAVDATGVGRPVFDLLRLAGMGCRVTGILITGGDVATPDKALSGYKVPKRDIVGILQLLFQQRRLKISPRLREAEAFLKELRDFKVRISDSTGNDSYGAWRSGEHDDLVLAAGIGIWLGNRYMPLPPGPPEPVIPAGSLVRKFFDGLVPDPYLPSPDLFAVGDYRSGKGGTAPADIRSGFAGTAVRTRR